MSTYGLIKAHSRLTRHEERGQVSFELVSLHDGLEVNPTALDGLGRPGVVHRDHIIPTFKLRLEDLRFRTERGWCAVV